MALRYPTQAEIRDQPEDLLEFMARGIQNFRAEHVETGDSHFLEAVANGQSPLMLVSKCPDSRQPVLLLFGLKPGTVFDSNSIAGFLSTYPRDPAVWAKIYYGVVGLGAPVVIKQGHTKCGGAQYLVKNLWDAAKREATLCGNYPVQNSWSYAARLATQPVRRFAATIDAAIQDQIAMHSSADPLAVALAEARPLVRRVLRDGLLANPDLTQAQGARMVEEEIVRDGVRKIHRFLDMLEQRGVLTHEKRPVVEGTLFDLDKAQLLHMQPNGEFRLLSEVLAEKASAACVCCERPERARFVCDAEQPSGAA